MTRSWNVLALVGLLAGLSLSGCASDEAQGDRTSSTSAPRPRPTFPPPVTTAPPPPPPPPPVLPPPPPPPTTSAAPPPTTTTSPPGGGGGGGGGLPPDNTPIVNETRVTFVGEATVTVAWNVTDDSAVMSRVEYGIGAGNFSSWMPNIEGTGDKTQSPSGLRPCTLYGYRVIATDSGGRRGVGLAGNPTFTTLGAAPSVLNITVNVVMHDHIRLQWRVTGAADVVTQVEYGTSTAYGSLTASQAGTGVKGVTIAGLVQNTVYHFRIKWSSGCGSGSTSDLTWETAQLVQVGIKGNLGTTGSYDPGSTLYGSLDLAPNKHYVLRVRNLDSVVHTFKVVNATGGTVYNSGNIQVAGNSGDTHDTTPSLRLAAGTYRMKCAIHGGMEGTIDV